MAKSSTSCSRFLKTSTIHDFNTLALELVSSIMVDGNSLGRLCLSLANGVWLEQTVPLVDSYKRIVETVYNPPCKQVDFRNKADEVAEEVNLWGKQKTNGHIKDILPPGMVTSSTEFILANAVYFKGVWIEKFNTSETKDHDFHLNNGSKFKVPFMTSKKEQFINIYEDFKVLGLPYEHGEDKRLFTMYVFLPDQKDGLPLLIQKISSESAFLKSRIPSDKVEVGQFLIPKFKISSGFDVSHTLRELGLSFPSIGDIIQKLFVEMNEEGTEAAAVTLCIVNESEDEPFEVDFVADHPFLFVIREDEWSNSVYRTSG